MSASPFNKPSKNMNVTFVQMNLTSLWNVFGKQATDSLHSGDMANLGGVIGR